MGRGANGGKEGGTYVGRLGVGDDVRVREAEDAREDEAHLVFREWLARGVVQYRRDHAR